MNKREVYLDNAATTAMCPEVIEAMSQCLKEMYGNPSALYALGDTARLAVTEARSRIAATLGCLPEEIYFTSGGSESDNWVIKGIADSCSDKGRHIITTAIEHKAVLKSCKWLEDHGYEVTYIQPDERGYINPQDIERAIRKDTILVSVMTANNEIGTIQPIELIGRICEKHGVLFHTDAVQAYGHIKLNVNDLHVSMLSASGHKFHGPKGVGFLYIKNGTPLLPLIHGGGQENHMRAGTENVPGIIGMGLAAEIADERILRGSDMFMSQLRDTLISEILKQISGSTLNGTLINRLPNNVNITFKGVAAQSAVGLLSDMGVLCSAGSACNNGDPAPSHVLMAIGRSPEDCRSTLRFTLDEDTTKDDIEYAIHMIKTVVGLLR